MTNHRRTCEANQQALKQQAHGNLNYRLNRRDPMAGPQGQDRIHLSMEYPDTVPEAGPIDYDNDDEGPTFDTDPPETPNHPTLGTNLDDIMIEFHPASERPTEQKALEELKVAEDLTLPYDSIPWRPFLSRFDYEVADFALRCDMNREKTQKLFRLLEEARNGAKVNMATCDQLQSLWDAAADRTTRFQTTQNSVPLREEIRTFDAYYRPIMNWLREVVQNEHLAPHMQWDARKQYRFDGQRWERFIDEPWTADSWWDAQTKINFERPPPSPTNSEKENGNGNENENEPQTEPGAKPLALILYADKNKLSSFGSAKGYPVMATIGNLPADIRNSTGVGGGRIVGWQPVESKHSSKKFFVDFKFIVWHVAFAKIIESVIVMSEPGIRWKCGDGVTRLIYFILLALSADYEEQCIMCLIRALKGLYPCPRCMIEKEELSDLSRIWKKRTAADVTEVLNEVDSFDLKKDQEVLLKEHSLRFGQNVFMLLANSDPFQAVSFDNLHFEDSGLWGSHLFKRLKEHFEAIGRKAEGNLDARFNNFPRWRNLHHPDAVTTVTFNNGSKHRDIARVFLFAAQGLFSEEEDPAAYQLLKCVRAYVNIMMYSGLHVQTSTTIAKGRECIRAFNLLLSKYMELDISEKMGPKNWGFIKVHYFNHLFDDIRQKGVLRNFSTQLFEKKHGPLRDIYHLRTNFKNIAPQHQRDVSDIIANEIKAMNEYKQYLESLKKPPEEVEVDEKLGGVHFSLGSKLKPATFREFCSSNQLTEVRFCVDLAGYLSKEIQALGRRLPNERWIQFTPNDQIRPYQYLKVNYESYENWKVTTDHLRCNPDFHKHARYNFIIYKAGTDQPVFAQLKHLFVCEIGEEKYALAYVESYETINIRRRSRSDRDFGLLRIRPVKHEFIWVDSIIRGALAADSVASEDGRIVVDTLDYDMFLRVKKHWPQYTEISLS
ncbi:hypothetical protein AAF712_015864 [Marasmius tenuissimus]|uniref:Uncharacterized protein n=1 Tax=Marasmius tenuissimus TaxID=585030 RepID=A0ABR2Z9B0_9AGAR